MKPIDMIFNVLTGPRLHPLREFAPTEAERNFIRIRAYERRRGESTDPLTEPHTLAHRCVNGLDALRVLKGYWNHRARSPRVRRKQSDDGNAIPIARKHGGNA